MHHLVSILALLAAAGCSTPKPAQRPPADVDGPVVCGKDRLKAKEVCFDHAKVACDSLACAHGCDILMASGSKWVVCSFNEASSSHLTRCAGYSNWQCPEDTTCVMDPGAEHIDDASGTCQRVTRP